MSGEVRVDVWLWAVRVFRTRSLSNAACGAGKVRVNDAVAKPAHRVRPGDVVAVRAGGRLRVLEVVATPSKRVGAVVAADALIDHSPPPEPRAARPLDQAVRDPGSGRPTKRDRRRIERLRGPRE